jgi:vancomycin permeability regulator SanA
MSEAEKRNSARRIARRIVIISIASAIALLIVTIIINLFMIIKFDKRILDPDEISDSEISVEYALVLGCQVKRDGTPTTMLAHRLKIGAELYFSGKVKKIIVSGDHTDVFFNEPQAMKDHLISLGVPEDAIIKDDHGFSTYDSIKHLKNKFSVDKVIIVSQKYHLYRAMHIACENKIDVYGASATLGSYDKDFFYELREYAARCKDAFITAFNFPPNDGTK